MWQWLVIAPAVAISAVYAAWKLMPAQTRLRLARWLSQRVAGGPAVLARLGERLERAALPAGGCDSCPATRLGPPGAGGKARPPR
jgi:hypothetical protein